MVASTCKTTAPQFYQNFNAFVKVLKDKEYQGAYLEDGGDSDLKNAYSSFMNSARDDVVQNDDVNQESEKPTG